MNNWKEVSLKNYCITQYGYTASATDNNTGVKFVRITDIVPDFIDWNKVPYCEISEKDFKKYKLNEGDIVAARTGATVGFAKQIRKGAPDAVFASYLVKLIPSEKVDKHFLGVLIESNVYREFIQIIAGGSAQPNANANDLTLFKFFLPPVPIQKRIASILSAYDDLVEVNNRRIKLLEETARELYKEWFVRMRFPGYKQAKFVKGVPEGWEVKSVSEIAEVTSSKRIFLSDYVAEGVPFYRGKEISIKSNNEEVSDLLYISKKKYEGIKKRFGVPIAGDILITAVGTIGNIYLVNEADGDFYFKDGNLIWLRKFNKHELSLYFYYHSISEVFTNSLNSITIGSSQEALTIASLKKILLLLPTEDLIDRFYQVAKPIKTQIEILQQQNTQLRQIRDRLLPRLISGKLEVKEI
ncbi:MAG: restriction endonuclease subunit S [Bacteroidetes bacterium]|nr:restriction endonuclease subunit S [Bacteroidota bacterium]